MESLSFLSTLIESLFPEFSPSQRRAFQSLQGDRNLFISGPAGSGKSYLLKKFSRSLDEKAFPMLASTGAAAVLLGGRTFHSFFGLGLMEGGRQATLDRALETVTRDSSGTNVRADMTYRIDPDKRAHNVFHGKIKNGVFTSTEPADIHLPGDKLGLGDAPGRKIRIADVAHLALPDQIIQRA